MFFKTSVCRCLRRESTIVVRWLADGHTANMRSGPPRFHASTSLLDQAVLLACHVPLKFMYEMSAAGTARAKLDNVRRGA